VQLVLTKSHKYLDAMMHIHKLQLLTTVPFLNTRVTQKQLYYWLCCLSALTHHQLFIVGYLTKLV